MWTSQTHTYTNMHTSTHIHKHTNTHTDTHTYTNVDTHPQAHTHTHWIPLQKGKTKKKKVWNGRQKNFKIKNLKKHTDRNLCEQSTLWCKMRRSGDPFFLEEKGTQQSLCNFPLLLGDRQHPSYRAKCTWKKKDKKPGTHIGAHYLF